MAGLTWPPRHTALVRVTHWLTALCALALIVSGFEIVVSHPRFYWGEDGNPMMPSLFDLPIPASRPWVNTGYGYVLPDQNGWSRNLHFQAAWIVVFTGLIYVTVGLVGTHFRRKLFAVSEYNPVQRLTYLGVIFVLFPLAIWTGLAMSPAIASVFPFLVTAFGGLQSARTIHFFASLLLVLFLAVHVVMVWRAGLRARLLPMIVNRSETP